MRPLRKIIRFTILVILIKLYDCNSEGTANAYNGSNHVSDECSDDEGSGAFGNQRPNPFPAENSSNNAPNAQRQHQQRRPDVSGLEFMGPPSATPAANLFKYSPITLDKQWSSVKRVLFLMFCSSCGTLTNGFFISAFFVEKPLRKAGFVFLACLGLSDIFLTGGVMSTAMVVLVSKEWDTPAVCRGLYAATMACCYSHSMCFLMTAMETHFRIFCTTHGYEFFRAKLITWITTFIYFISITLSVIGVYMSLDVDYCEHHHAGSHGWRLATGLTFHAIPVIITAMSFIVSVFGINSRARRLPTYRRSEQFQIDKSINNLNLFAFLLYVGFWMPYIYASYVKNDISSKNYYYAAWIGMFRSVLNANFYCLFSRNFKRAFIINFNYCCCKRPITDGNRRRRVTENRPTSTEMRVHMMQPAVGAGSLQRSVSGARHEETHDL